MSNSSAHSDQEEEDEQMNDDEGPTMVTLRTGHNDSYNQGERVREISATELEATQMTKEGTNTVHKHGVVKGQQSLNKFFMSSPNK